MATYKPLSTDFKDDILASQNSKRKYTQVNNSDGTVSFQDSTAYSQVGSSYGAKEIIEEREAINNIYANKLVTLDEIDLVTEPGFFVDAQVVKELNSNNIVDSGHNANGYWRKYGDGTLEMWNNTYIGRIDISTADNWNYYAGKFNIVFPVKPLTIAFPTVTARGACAPWASVPENGLGAELFQVWIYSSNRAKNVDIWVSWHAFGAWK